MKINLFFILLFLLISCNKKNYEHLCCIKWTYENDNLTFCGDKSETCDSIKQSLEDESENYDIGNCICAKHYIEHYENKAN